MDASAQNQIGKYELIEKAATADANDDDHPPIIHETKQY